MRTAVSSLSLQRPRTLGDALRMLREEGPLTPIAGCTDVYVGLQFGTLAERRFVDLWPLDELRGIQATADLLRIGALTTFTDLIGSAVVRRRVPMLIAAAREVGGRQIQNRGTIGGNIANASPAGDSLPVLAAANATVVLRSVDGERRVPFTAFYTGYRASVRRPDELIAAIEIPRIDGNRHPFRRQSLRLRSIDHRRNPAGGTKAPGRVLPTPIPLHCFKSCFHCSISADSPQLAADS